MKPNTSTQPSTRQLLTLGLSQAAGFVVGGLLGYALGQATGMDAMDPAGYTTSAMVGLLMIGLGSGACAQLAKRLHTRYYRNTTAPCPPPWLLSNPPPSLHVASPWCRWTPATKPASAPPPQTVRCGTSA